MPSVKDLVPNATKRTFTAQDYLEPKTTAMLAPPTPPPRQGGVGASARTARPPQVATQALTTATTPTTSSRYPTQRFSVYGGIDASQGSPTGYQISSVLIGDDMGGRRKAYAVGDELPDGSKIQDIQRRGMGQMAVSVVLPDGREEWLGHRPSVPADGLDDGYGSLSSEDMAHVDKQEAWESKSDAAWAKDVQRRPDVYKPHDDKFRQERDLGRVARIAGLQAAREAGFGGTAQSSVLAVNPDNNKDRMSLMFLLPNGDRQQVFYEFSKGDSLRGTVVEGPIFPGGGQ